MTDNAIKLMNTNEAAELLGITPRYLEKRRNNGLGPAYIRLSPKAARYGREDLETYLDDPLHSAAEAAARLGVSTAAFINMTAQPDGPRERTVGAVTGYSKSDIDAFIARCRLVPAT